MLIKKVNVNSDDSIKSFASYLSTSFFILFHIFYLTFFIVNKAWIMAYFNIFSIWFYLLMFIVVYKKHYSILSYAVALEILIHMSVAAITCGVDCGFQLCLIGVCTIIFFTGYLSKKSKGYVKAIPECIFSGLLFIIVYFHAQRYSPRYTFSIYEERFLFILHTIIVFGFVITFLQVMVKYAVFYENKILNDARTDKLTQIPNRNALNDYFEKIKGQRENYVLAIFDIDNFKKFNDKNGHLCGDYVLKEISKIAVENSDDDFVSRWGGEEFVVISKMENSYNQTCAKIDGIRMKVENHEFIYGKKKLKCTITVGVTEYIDDLNLDEWIKHADDNLYRGKNNGKNQLVS